MRKLGRDHIVVAEGLSVVNFNKMIVLNETAAYLWDEVQGKDFDADLLSSLLQSRYDVDPARSLEDARTLIDKWTEAGITE